MHARRSPRLLRLLVLTALLAPVLGPAAPATAAITLVQNLGTGSGHATSITIMTTGAVTAGNSIVVSVATNGTINTITCSDPINGAYATDVQITMSVPHSAICSKHNVLALPINTLITVSSSNSVDIAASATEFAGLAATVTLDQTARAGGFNASPSVTLGATTSQADELLLGAIDRNNGSLGTGFTAGTNGTVTPCTNTSSPSYSPLPPAQQAHTLVYPEYCIVAAPGTYQAAGTFDASDLWTAVLATYKEASPTPTNTPTSTATPTATGTPTTTPTPTATPCILGDINCDGIVDIRDYGVWRQNFGQTNCGNRADLNGDCIVDIRDYGIWRTNFGHISGVAARTATPVAAPRLVPVTPAPTAGRPPASGERGSGWGALLEAVQALGSILANQIMFSVAGRIQ